VISRQRERSVSPAVWPLCRHHPCPCGWFGDPQRPAVRPKPSGSVLGQAVWPLLDRIDLQVVMRRAGEQRPAGFRPA